MSLVEYIDALRKRPPLKLDTSESAFWERYNNGEYTSKEFCYAIGLVEVTDDN